MMQALIQRMAFEGRRTARRAARGSAVFRRLAIEAVEDRLLLSATAGASACEGGTVLFGSLAPGLASGSSRVVELDGRLVIEQTGQRLVAPLGLQWIAFGNDVAGAVAAPVRRQCVAARRQAAGQCWCPARPGC